MNDNETQPQGYFVQPEFIAAIYWFNNDKDTPVPKKIEIPVSNSAVGSFVKYLENNALDNINEDTLEEMLKIAKWFNHGDLKSLLLDWMMTNLNLDNAVKFYLMNKQYSLGGMVTFQTFILKNFKELNKLTHGFPTNRATLFARTFYLTDLGNAMMVSASFENFIQLIIQ